MINENITFITAFIAGLLTFFAPCTFVTLPSFISILAYKATGVDLSKSKHAFNKPLLITSLLYISGFLIIFTLLGMQSTLIGSLLLRNRVVLYRVGGLLIILMGLIQLYGHKVQLLRFLYQERKIEVNKSKSGYFYAFVLGLTSALSWTPCIGPTLASILFLAGSRLDTIYLGGALLFVYGLGISLPFLIIALTISKSQSWIKKFAKYTPIINKVSGWLLIIIGLGLFTNSYGTLFGIVSSVFYKLGYKPQ